MKSLLKSFLINATSLWFVDQLLSCFLFAKGWETLLLTAIVLGLVNLFIKPLINILLLPINLLTLGAMRWLVNVISLYLVTLFVSDFRIGGVFFRGISYQGLVVPPFSVSSGILALILVSLVLSAISGFLFWLTK